MSYYEYKFKYYISAISGFTFNMQIDEEDTLVYAPLTSIAHMSNGLFTGSVSNSMLKNSKYLYNLYDAKIIDDPDFLVNENFFNAPNDLQYDKQKPYMLTRIDYMISNDNNIVINGLKPLPSDEEIAKYEKSLIAMTRYIEFTEMNVMNFYRKENTDFGEACYKLELFQEFCNLMNLEQHVIQTYKNTSIG